VKWKLNWIRWILKKIKIIPIIGIPIFAVLIGVLIFPLFDEPKEKSINIWEESAKAQSIATLEKGMVEAMKSDCGSTNTILCEKLDKIIENQEIIKDQLTELYDMES